MTLNFSGIFVAHVHENFTALSVHRKSLCSSTWGSVSQEKKIHTELEV